jgi:DNA-binding MarR family transcriptional regulator
VSDRPLNENMLGVLRVLAEADKPLPAAQIAHALGKRHGRPGNHGRGNTTRLMSPATRVTPAITALRKRGFIRFTERPDGLSGTADYITDEGRKALREADNT